ncbi:flavodoxin domain-containing protein [Acetobacterium sp. UBA5834]|jgi:menaquinone-dependent protoporphyrinogen oxidase|uniref:flavodoxin domain-containing protein n=1 Tax=Acetobacterium sp. UBA5834 TaxID=1945907 RepID=UPI00257EF92B|nr:flavodoxin domain-containing protein [Acetobacterium sp. UBA5834]
MKTLILYASTYGFTKDCVQMLKKNVNGDVQIVNITKESIPTLDDYDTILIGGSIYMGQIQKPIKNYCLKNLDALKNKKIGFFISCGSAEHSDDYFKTAFPETLLNQAVSIENFGGEMRPDKMNFFHKFVSNMVEKSSDKNNTPPMKPLPENILNMATIINNLS